MREHAVFRGVTIVELDGVVAAFGDAGSGLVGNGVPASAANWWTSFLGRDVPVLWPEQRHTSIVYSHGSRRGLAPGPHRAGICDGIVTAEPMVAVMVQTADCLPIVLAGQGIVAVIHAGWRGLADDILGKAVRRIEVEYGARPEELEAVIGIGIGRCHYGVGDDVREALATHDVGGVAWRHGLAVDLSAWAAGRLNRTGLPNNGITRLPGCTACLPSLNSYRRDSRLAGRQWSSAILRSQRE